MRGGMRIAAALLGAAVGIAACSGSTETNPGTGGSTSSSSSSSSGNPGGGGAGGSATGGGGAGGTGGAADACTNKTDTVLAVSSLYFGDRDWDDQASDTAWSLFGLDIDGKSSTDTSTDVCQPVGGASAANVYPDGPGGLDNSFGKNVIPYFVSSIPSLSSQANLALLNGDFTILFRLEGLGAGADQASIPAKVYGGAFLQAQPLFDGTDCWPATAESLDNPTDLASAKLSFPASALTGNKWDSVSTGDLNLTLQVLSFQGHVVIHHARVLMDLDADHNGTSRGIISGILDTEEFVSAINYLLSSFDAANCQGSTLIQQVDAAIRAGSDIMKDGTQDPTATCDGISIGLGFQAKRVRFGAVADPLTPKPDPCGN